MANLWTFSVGPDWGEPRWPDWGRSSQSTGRSPMVTETSAAARL